MPRPEMALSVQQPWAWLLLHGELRILPDGRKVGYKDCENRIWPLPRSMWGKRNYVHAGKTVDDDGCAWVYGQSWIPQEVKDAIMSIEMNWTRKSGLVGEITLVRDVLEYDSRWANGPHIWLVSDPVAYDRMIPMAGRLRFFKPELPQ